MEFNDANDVKMFISNILIDVNDESDLCCDLKWFSNINYSTPTEYYGELMLFLGVIINDKRVEKHKDDIQKLTIKLKELFA